MSLTVTAAAAARRAAPLAQALRTELPVAGWSKLSGAKLVEQLKSAHRGVALTADQLRADVQSLAMAQVKMNDAGLVTYLDQVVPPALKTATADDKVSLLVQALDSGVPKSAVNRWVPEGWGTVGTPESPLLKNAADLSAFGRRLGAAFPRAEIVARPQLTSVLALPRSGAPIRLTAAGHKLSLSQGIKTVQQSVPMGATSAQIDAAVAELALKLAR